MLIFSSLLPFLSFVFFILLLLLNYSFRVFFLLLKKGWDTFLTYRKWFMFLKNHSNCFYKFSSKKKLKNTIMVHLFNMGGYHYPLFIEMCICTFITRLCILLLTLFRWSYCAEVITCVINMKFLGDVLVQ
jgi:hypothetical protein